MSENRRVWRKIQDAFIDGLAAKIVWDAVSLVTPAIVIMMGAIVSFVLYNRQGTLIFSIVILIATNAFSIHRLFRLSNGQKRQDLKAEEFRGLLIYWHLDPNNHITIDDIRCGKCKGRINNTQLIRDAKFLVCENEHRVGSKRTYEEIQAEIEQIENERNAEIAERKKRVAAEHKRLKQEVEAGNMTAEELLEWEMKQPGQSRKASVGNPAGGNYFHKPDFERLVDEIQADFRDKKLREELDKIPITASDTSSVA